MFLFPASVALLRASENRGGRLPLSESRFAWFVVGLMASVLIGYRNQVGGDWQHYVDYYFASTDFDFGEFVWKTDPGYGLLNWLCAEFDWGILRS